MKWRTLLGGIVKVLRRILTSLPPKPSRHLQTTCASQHFSSSSQTQNKSKWYFGVFRHNHHRKLQKLRFFFPVPVLPANRCIHPFIHFTILSCIDIVVRVFVITHELPLYSRNSSARGSISNDPTLTFATFI